MENSAQVQLTADGSHTISIPGRAITYHSRHGAIQESQHVFIQTGLEEAVRRFPDTRVKLFEMGFGTGLNAFLTAIEAGNRNLLVNYTSVEAFPLQEDVWRVLNYAATLGDEELFEAIHGAAWNTSVAITPVFNLTKIHGQLELLDIQGPLHLIYFDAFGPEDDPQLWTEDIFSKLYSALIPGGLLTTYCSKSAVRRALKAVGFRVEKIPGPPGKREIVRASKP
jgi:tRNA U34 5-methylaminomethyl-2-thiouridine-forming methyltransferase MnmC